MKNRVNWIENTPFSYSDNFNSVELSFTEKGFHFSFYNEAKCDGETLDVEFHGDFPIVINQEGNGSYGCYTADNFGGKTRDEINKYMTETAAFWIAQFVAYFIEDEK